MMKSILFVTVAIVLGGDLIGENPNVVARFVAESKATLSLMESKTLSTTRLSEEEAIAADEYIRSHQNYTAYHLLFALQREVPKQYGSIPDTIRANVLCSALANLRYLNDWGFLEPSEPFDGQAAKALLATGRSALNCLKALLNDGRSAPLFGTEEATMSSIYRYRRKDFAYRYASLILARSYRFVLDPSERDRDIKKLQAELEP